MAGKTLQSTSRYTFAEQTADPHQNMSNAANVVENDQALTRIKELEAQLASCNEKILLEGLGFPRRSKHYQELLNTAEELSGEYRKQDDFDDEMRLYLSQQERFTRGSDNSSNESGFITWEMCKGECCLHYKKKAEALQHLELAFQRSRDAVKDLVSPLDSKSLWG